MTTNRQIRLRSRPDGIPRAENFELVEAPLGVLPEGRFRVRNVYLSVDPAMRGWVSAVGNYATPVQLAEVMRSFAVGEVVESRHPDYALGESLLGLTLIGEPRPGETVVVSTAAGGVGAAVGQIAKILGCRAVGIAGGPRKTALCVEAFGYDEAFDYKAATDLSAAISGACPDGVHVYFDNTAGWISDAVTPHLAIGARVVICGTASIAAWEPPPLGPRVERHLLVKRARMQGFLYFDHLARVEAAVAQLASWLREGRLRHREDILEGLEAAPDAIAGLYRGENLGKRLIRLGAN